MLELSMRPNPAWVDVTSAADDDAQVRIVLDTSVLVSAVRSTTGASFALVSQIPSRHFQIALSVALYAEWQDVLTRPEHVPAESTAEHMLAFLGYLAAQAHLQEEIYFRLRPLLPDPNDDMIAELAFSARCPLIVTHNLADFRGVEPLGIRTIRPRDMLNYLRLKASP